MQKQISRLDIINFHNPLLILMEAQRSMLILYYVYFKVFLHGNHETLSVAVLRGPWPQAPHFWQPRRGPAPEKN